MCWKVIEMENWDLINFYQTSNLTFFREAVHVDKSKLNTLSWSEIKRQIDSSNISVVIVADDRYSNSLKKNTFLPSYPLHHVT